MREATVKRLETIANERTGYITTEELLKSGITNRQIAVFVDKGMLEKISHGHYWLACAGCGKPAEYKAVELCITNPRLIICADSACFYQGLISVEPERVSAATRRSDRSRFRMNFPVSRHYFGDSLFREYSRKIETAFGSYTVYDLERSVCDVIRFKDSIDPAVFDLIIDSYRRSEAKQVDRLLEYAAMVRILNRVKNYL